MSKYPTGAEALLIAMNTPSPSGLLGIPVLIWGRPGVGKSSFIESLGNVDCKVRTMIASIYDPTDFSGLPIYDDGKVKYASPEWTDEFNDHKTGILFLDELSTCPPSVQAALLRVILERTVGFKKLPDHVRIIAAANPPSLTLGGWDLSPPMRNRFLHVQWDIPQDVYLNALANGWADAVQYKIDPKQHRQQIPAWKDKIGAFLRINPDALHGDPSKENFGYASPRSWDYLIHLLASCDVLEKPIMIELLEGCVGEGTAIALYEFLNTLKQPDPIDVLSGKVNVEFKELNDGEIYILFNGMERVLSDERFEDDFLDYADKFLSITQSLTLLGKRDVVFVSLQKLAKQGFLTKVISQSQSISADRYSVFMDQITRIFNEEGLVEFIDILS
ncbi:MAG: MoxR family ATPase [Bacteroidota bacterium]